MDLRDKFRGHGFWLLKSETFCESESSQQSRDLHEKSVLSSVNIVTLSTEAMIEWFIVKAWVALKLVFEEDFRRNDVGTENAVGVVDTGKRLS